MVEVHFAWRGNPNLHLPLQEERDWLVQTPAWASHGCLLTFLLRQTRTIRPSLSGRASATCASAASSFPGATARLARERQRKRKKEKKKEIKKERKRKGSKKRRGRRRKKKNQEQEQEGKGDGLFFWSHCLCVNPSGLALPQSARQRNAARRPRAAEGGAAARRALPRHDPQHDGGSGRN
jgi:hypothetical protein